LNSDIPPKHFDFYPLGVIDVAGIDNHAPASQDDKGRDMGGLKKYHVIAVMAGVVWMAAAIARGAGVGSPETQGQGKFAVAAEWDYIFERNLIFQSASRPAGHENDRPENFRIRWISKPPAPPAR